MPIRGTADFGTLWWVHCSVLEVAACLKKINLASQMMQETKKPTNGSNIQRVLSIFIEGICSYAHKNHQFCFKKAKQKNKGIEA